MGKLVVSIQVTVNGSFEAPSPEAWLTLDPDSVDAGLEQLTLADAMLLGRKTYEGLAAVWPHLADDPAMGRFAARINAMPKCVASCTLSAPLDWNAELIDGDLVAAVRDLKAKHDGSLRVSGCGSFAHTLIEAGLVDELWFWINPHVWPTGPRILDGIGPLPLELIAVTPYRSGVVWLRYRPASD